MIPHFSEILTTKLFWNLRKSKKKVMMNRKCFVRILMMKFNLWTFNFEGFEEGAQRGGPRRHRSDRRSRPEGQQLPGHSLFGQISGDGLARMDRPEGAQGKGIPGNGRRVLQVEAAAAKLNFPSLCIWT